MRFGYVEARLELDGPIEDDSASDVTAIHLMGRMMREQKHAEAHPKPANPAMKLESSGSGVDATHTVTSLTAMKTREAAGPASAAPAGRELEKSSKATALLIADIVALGLIVFVWLQWGRK